MSCVVTIKYIVYRKNKLITPYIYMQYRNRCISCAHRSNGKEKVKVEREIIG